MKFSQTTKSVLTYATCLMLALAMPMSVYATDDVVATDGTVTQVETPQQTAPDALVAQTVPTETTQEQAPVAEQPTAETQNSTNAESSTTSTNSAAIANGLDSTATSGNATVKDNTTAGNATSGNAAATATIVNNVNSTMSNSGNKEAATFVKDVYGDVNGDIILEPLLLKAMLEANIAQANQKSSTNATNDTSITNGINLNATSGNAKVKDNRNAGNATTGSADTVVNMVNMVNSMIAANQSFTGTVNIYGNLNGDILIAPDFMAQMLANNGSAASSEGSGVSQINNRDTQEIVNNVSLVAESGNALVRDNNNAGSATSGDAKTNLVIFNLSGHEIVASNSLLVFINVLGQWVGVIVDAPVGATAGAIGSNVTTNTVQPSVTVNTTNDAAITNDINLVSRSGDAVVADNNTAGDATSGRATASANIANVSNSSVGLTGWFGILFINVFGIWNGSFGVDTSAGDTPESETKSEGGQPVRFVPRQEKTDESGNRRLVVVDPSQAEDQVELASVDDTNGSVKAAEDKKSDIPTQQSYIDGRKGLNIPMAIGSLVVLIGSGFVLRKFLF